MERSAREKRRRREKNSAVRFFRSIEKSVLSARIHMKWGRTEQIFKSIFHILSVFFRSSLSCRRHQIIYIYTFFALQKMRAVNEKLPLIDGKP